MVVVYTATTSSSRQRSPPQLQPLPPSPRHTGTMALVGLSSTSLGQNHSQATRGNSRPLPRLPTEESWLPVHRDHLKHHTLSPQSERLSTNLNDISTPLLRPQPISSYLPASSRRSPSLVTALDDPNILHAVVWSLEWADTYNLFTTCKRLSDTFRDIPLRDIVLSRFVPEYAPCLRDRDMQYYQDITITVHDLDRLLISQRVGLHRYPIHALKLLQSLNPTLEDERLRKKLVALSQAHSRFVLLLQSIVHSSSASIPQESEEGTYRPRFSPIQTLRELTFPAPLSYAESPTTRAAGSEVVKHSRHKSAPARFRSPSTPNRRPTWSLDKPKSPRASADAVSTMISTAPMRKARKLSIFGRKRPTTPPPPPDEPRALKMYSSTWRKSSMYRYSPIAIDFSNDTGGNGVSLKQIRASMRQRHGSVHDSSDSSSLSIPRSRNSLTNMNRYATPEAKSNSPHDLILATSRVRAPILRAFVPCTQLDADGASLTQCEQQLMESGIWDHLSTGDIICNLGYVPPVEDTSSCDGEDASPWSEFLTMKSGSRYGSGLVNPSLGANSARKWLVFNGYVLVPYTPPDLLPLGDPLNLPTPFYYAHIMSPFSNPSFVITKLPVCDDVPQLTLVQSFKKVPSPHSPNGHALVKKYSWTARVVRLRTEADGEMGEGWFGEWVLEGEGTPEGKQLLINALKGRDLGHCEWELVREKSGGGKHWLRFSSVHGFIRPPN